MIREMVSDPDSFLEKKMTIGKLTIPIVIVLLAGLANALHVVAGYLALDSEELSEAINALIIYGGYTLVIPIVLWIGFTAAFYLLSIAFGGKPLVGHLLRGVGWGFLPLIPAIVIWHAGRYAALRDATFPEITRTGIEWEVEALQTYFSSVFGEPVYVGATIIACLFVALSGYLWTAVVSRGCNLDRRKSLVVTWIPTIGFIAYILYNAL